MKGMAESLGFEYISASGKDEFMQICEKFISPEMSIRPLFFEVFTNDTDESEALYKCRHLVKSPFSIHDMKKVVKSLMGAKVVDTVKRVIK